MFRRLDYAALARDRAQPGAHARGAAARAARGRGGRPGVPRALRSSHCGARRVARGGQHLVGAPLPAPGGTDDRLLLRRVRAASVAADLCRRSWRAGRATTARRRATSASRSSASASCIRKGYFHQHVSADGWQEESNELLNWADAPIEQATTPDGKPCLTPVPLDDRSVLVAVWRVRVGRVQLYLLDTNLEENAPWDRELSARLYGGDRETRVQQEIILGIGGVRALRALGIEPAVFHLNEGHAAFVVLQRIRELIDRGSSFDDALEEIRQTHDLHDTHAGAGRPRRVSVPPRREASRRLLGNARRPTAIGSSRSGRTTAAAGAQFNMTALALRSAGKVNAVSQLHGEVTRAMWDIWPGVPEAAAAGDLRHQRRARADVDRRGSRGSVRRRTSAPTGSTVRTIRRSGTACCAIPDDELWRVRQTLRRYLFAFVRERARQRWTDERVGIPARRRRRTAARSRRR